MKEKSLAGGSRKVVGAAAMPEGSAGRASDAGVVEASGVAARGGPKVLARPGLPPKRPPERLSQPSTFSLKKSVRTIRLEVMPPCEWPTNQKALMFSLPTWSYTRLTMFCRYSSSVCAQNLVGEFGVAMTRRYFSL